jgi:hypothetical protein
MNGYHYALALLVVVLMLWHMAMRRRRRRRREPRLGRGLGWGTVYVFRDRTNPRLLKVGTTRRLSKTRKGEVSRTMANGAELVQAYAVNTAYAAAVETLALRTLRRHRAKVGRGREWFWATGDGGIGHIVDAVRRAAAEVRGVAARCGRWPADMDDRAREVYVVDGRLARRRLFGTTGTGQPG